MPSLGRNKIATKGMIVGVGGTFKCEDGRIKAYVINPKHRIIIKERGLRNSGILERNTRHCRSSIQRCTQHL